MKDYSQLDFQPLNDYVLIDPIKVNETEGGIALPEGAQTGPPKGRVAKVGPGRVSEEGKVIPPPVQPGDVVYMILPYNQVPGITLDGHDYAMVRARDLIAVVGGKDAKTS